ncbi:hypothetical protein [Legionella jordanis]|uniref:Interaptin n=1 Tax=Legionella jordanis TaxID=456 RepID=A0A0W0V9C0_9GAMM|nr:hypothetical protein [Legionella jordanis]KTD16737.1 interaptin [Legionella jordanis]RMX03735.1 hypothetical protein EAW55_05035 [Legionella jordanis]VEH11794.1 interaptin [Legionella jordanis]
MAQNPQLAQALGNPPNPQDPAYIKALNDMLAIDTRNLAGSVQHQVDFRKAVLDNRAYWQANGVNIRADQRDDDNNFLGWNAGANQDFNSLRKKAAELRVLLGLSNASEQVLKDIIDAAASSSAMRTVIAGQTGANSAFGEFSQFPGWANDNEDVLTNASMNRIKEAAQKELLLKRIEATTDPAKLSALLNSVGNDANFRAAVKNLFDPPIAGADAGIDAMSSARLNDVARAATKKAYALAIAAKSDEDIIAANLNATLNEQRAPNFNHNLARFIPGIPGPGLNDEGIAAIKGILGARYLKAELERSADVALLEGMAAAQDSGTARGFIRADVRIGGAYVDQALTDANLANIKLAAASQALKLKLGSVTDLDALDALSRVSNHNELQQVLATQNSLGYAANQPFRTAFTGQTALKGITAIASIRKHLIAAQNATQLKEFVLADANANNGIDFIGKYNQLIAPNTATAEEQQYLKTNAAALQQLALDTLAKNELGKPGVVSDANLVLMAAPGTAQNLQDATGALLGVPGASPSVQALITGTGTGIANRLKALASLEAVLRSTKDIDLAGPNFNGYVGKINDLTQIAAPSGINGANALPNSNGVNVAGVLAQLTTAETQAFQVNLVENLVRNYPGDQPLQNLKALAEAKDLTTFKDKLTAIGITSQDWVNADVMKKIQAAACTKVIQKGLGNASTFEDRPALMAVIAQLPADKQQTLMAKPAILRSLMAALSPEAIQQVLGNNQVSASSMAALEDENNQLALASGIANPKLAEVIGSLTFPTSRPKITLDSDKVARINQYILTTATADFTGNAGNYEPTVKAIAQIAGLPEDALYGTLGFNPVGSNVAGQPQGSLHQQKQHNQQLEIQYGASQSAGEKAILEFLMSLNKKAVFPNADIAAAVKAFKEAANPDEFITKLKAIPGLITGQAGEIFSEQQLKNQVNSGVYSHAKAAVLKTTFLDTRPQGVYAEMMDLTKQQGLDRKAYEDLHRQIVDKDKAIHSELAALANTSAIDWFNPSFQSSARQNARDMLPRYRELDKASSTLVTFFQNELALLDEQIRTLPTEQEMTRAFGANPAFENRKSRIREYRQELETRRNAAAEELKRYEEIQTLLHGNPGHSNPLLQNGILNTLEQVEKGGDIRFKSFSSTFSDHPVTKKAELLRTGTGDVINPRPATLHGGVAARRFETATPIPNGHLRYHSVRHGNAGAVGTFIEEVQPSKSSVNKSGRVEYSSDYTITLGNLPNDAAGKQTTYMSMAMQALKNHGKPTADRPIYLTAYDRAEAEGLWLAMMAIGQNDPSMKFNPEHVKVMGASGFKPEAYLKRSKTPPFGHHVSHPNYNAFLQSAPCQSGLDDMKDFTKVKHGKETEVQKEKSNKAVTKVTDHYKNGLKTLISQAEQKNAEEEQKKPSLGGMQP